MACPTRGLGLVEAVGLAEFAGLAAELGGGFSGLARCLAAGFAQFAGRIETGAAGVFSCFAGESRFVRPVVAMAEERGQEQEGQQQ